jgi:ABC-type protease/lipase transport system fused ATPase/permease subunit
MAYTHKPPQPTGNDELRQALRACAKPFIGVAMVSALVNILALTGSLYMLQVYDRVLPSRSMSTLVGLTILMLGLYIAFGFFDYLRNRVMMRIGFASTDCCVSAYSASHLPSRYACAIQPYRPSRSATSNKFAHLCLARDRLL